MKNLPARTLPDQGKPDLIPPNMDYVYFDGSDVIRPDPSRTDYSPANAWWFAECAFRCGQPGKQAADLLCRIQHADRGFRDQVFIQRTPVIIGPECRPHHAAGFDFTLIVAHEDRFDNVRRFREP